MNIKALRYVHVPGIGYTCVASSRFKREWVLGFAESFTPKGVDGNKCYVYNRFKLKDNFDGLWLEIEERKFNET